ncbi:MAG: twin-arginine translocase TatA/TatE family subunit [Deltaproteobacteria bacterium]|nr:twin-arginine translocase TatA/TatE family subunit [Deltaproteobacteria bacterium]HCH65091.1 twin-arginine translocase TatA/TatE family subunit [Deltaproteobacteria bacterium]
MVLGVGFGGPWEWGVVLVIVLIFFGVGKLPKVLGQMGKGVKAFKDGMKDTDDEKLARAIDAMAPESEEDEVTVSEAEELTA